MVVVDFWGVVLLSVVWSVVGGVEGGRVCGGLRREGGGAV